MFTIKRSVDILFALAMGSFLSPLIAIIVILSFFKIGRPIFFRQKRIGLNNKTFLMLKFRTMRGGTGSDAERLTRYGQFLRSSSLDELPELWNILKGDMSLVGPRPLLPEYLPFYTSNELKRHQMRPGITGLAQVSGRNMLTWDKRLAFDVQYVEHWNLWLDIRILFKTLLVVCNRSGISAEGHATMPRLDEERSAIGSSAS